MLEIYMEAVFLTELIFHAGEQIFITICSLPALTAYQVMMPFFCVMIYRLVIQFAFIDAAGFFKQFES
jgi:hypothetical protein